MLSGPILGNYQRVAVGDTQLVTATSSITSVINDTGSNIMCSWVEQFSSTPFDAHAILIKPITFDYWDYLIDIGLGNSGQERILISCLYFSGGGNYMRHARDYLLPLYIPEGSRISMRFQIDSSGTYPLAAQIMIFEGSFLSQAYQECQSIGIDTSDSGGAEVDSGGIANTKGAWSFIGRPTKDIKGFIFCIGIQQNNGRPDTYGLLDIAIGEEGDEEIIIPDYSFGTDTWTDALSPTNSPYFPISIPKNTRIAARSQMDITDATDRKLDVMIYGMV